MRTEETETIAWKLEGPNPQLDRPIRFNDCVSSHDEPPSRLISTIEDKVLLDCRVIRLQDSCQGNLHSSNIVISIATIMIEYLELQRLMSLEIVVYYERFHEIWIQVVLHDFCLVRFDPLPCPPPIAMIVS